MPHLASRPLRSRIALAPTALAFVAAACSADGPTAVGGRAPGLTVIGAGQTDTVKAYLRQHLVAEVRDAAGSPVAGVAVRFSARRVESGRLIASKCGADERVCDPNADVQGNRAVYVDTTDASGRATARVRAGEIAATGSVGVDVPALALAGDAPLTVRPGRPVGLGIWGRDQFVYVGERRTLRAALNDQWGNDVEGAATFTVAGDAAVVERVDGSSASVTPRRLGSFVVLARSGAFSDSTVVMAPPRGTITAVSAAGSRSSPSDGVVRFTLDRTASRQYVGLYFLYQFAVSPDGERAITVLPVGGARLHIAPQDGTPRRRMTTDAEGLTHELSPTFAPGGGSVYFSGRSAAHGSALYRVPADGGAVELIGSQSADTADQQPSVSPGGRRLAYVAADGATSLRVWELASGTSTPLGVSGRRPDWRHDGQAIAFVRGTEVWTVNADGSGARRVSAADRPYQAGGRVSWSPDGRWIAAARNLDRGTALDAISVETGATIVLGTGLSDPRWSR